MRARNQSPNTLLDKLTRLVHNASQCFQIGQKSSPRSMGTRRPGFTAATGHLALTTHAPACRLRHESGGGRRAKRFISSTTERDIQMASTNKQWYFAPGFLIRLFCACCLLLSSAAFAQTNATIIAHEFSPALITVGKSTEFIITLENTSTSPLSGQDIVYFVGWGNEPVITSITSSTCGSPGLTVNPGSSFELNSISLPAALSTSTPATCKIALSMQGPHAGDYELYFDDTNSSVDPGSNFYQAFSAIPTVMVDARFNPPLLNAPGTSQFEMILFNLDKSQFSGGEYSYTFPSNLTLSSAPSSSTCPSGVTANASGTTLTVNNLGLNAATDTAPYTCKIVFDVTASAMGSYLANFSTLDADSIAQASLSTSLSSPKLVVNSLPPAGKANGFASLNSRIILPGQTAFLTIHVESLAAVPNLELEYLGDSPDLQQINPISTCDQTQFTHTAPGVIQMSFTSIAGSCDITIPVTASRPGFYRSYLLPVNTQQRNYFYIGSNNYSGFTEEYLYVLSGFKPAGPAPASVPSLSNPLLLLLALLMAGFTAMRFRARMR
jgi:hypothetical protein